jgi:hypothetical protein
MFGRAAASHVGGRSAICAGRAHVRVPCGKPRQTVDPVPTAVRQAGRVGLGVKWERRSAVRCGQTRSCALIAAASTPLNCRNVVEQRLCALERSVRDEEVVGSNPATPTQVRGLLRSWLGPFRLTVQQLSSWDRRSISAGPDPRPAAGRRSTAAAAQAPSGTPRGSH